MVTKLDPIISEFETQEDADAYDAWYRETVQRALEDKRPGVPHEEAMARLRAAVERGAARKKKAG